MNPEVAGSIIGGGSSLAGSIINGGMNLLGMHKQYQYNKKLAEQQNQYNIDMWNMQNEYNSPTAQMARLKDAGLNPNLAYGNVSTGNATHAPEQVAPNAPNAQQAMKDAGAAFNPEQIINFAIATKKGLAEAQKSEEEAREAGANADIKEAHAQSLFAPGNNRFWYYDPNTGIIEQSPENEVTVQRWKDNPYRKGINITQASLANAIKMRNEYLKGANIGSQIGYRNKQGFYIDARTGLTKKEAERVGNINNFFLYNEILKGVNAGAHLIGSFAPFMNIFAKMKGLFPQKPIKTGTRTAGIDSNGRGWSQTTEYMF